MSISDRILALTSQGGVLVVSSHWFIWDGLG